MQVTERRQGGEGMLSLGKAYSSSTNLAMTCALHTSAVLV